MATLHTILVPVGSVIKLTRILRRAFQAAQHMWADLNGVLRLSSPNINMEVIFGKIGPQGLISTVLLALTKSQLTYRNSSM